jgi:hypothetical protein
MKPEDAPKDLSDEEVERLLEMLNETNKDVPEEETDG